MTIIFYDIPSATPENSWSVNLWKTRFNLNYKGIPYRTEWVEYPDIESHAKQHGIEPTGKWPDGRTYYSLPAIYDPSTGVYISDSLKIAQYLEQRYPHTPTLFPSDTISLQAAFTDAFWAKLDAFWTFIFPVQYGKLNPPSQVYYRRTREALFGKKLEELAPTGDAAVEQWAKFESALGVVDGWYQKNGGKGLYLLGETPSWGDFVVAATFIWIRIIFGVDSQQWKDISSWHCGRWVKLLDSFKEYQTVV